MIRFSRACAFCFLALTLAHGQPNAQLEDDWLFQCDNAPTVEKAKQEIGWARALAGRIASLKGAPDLSAQIAALADLEKRAESAAASPETAKALYLTVRAVKRELVFKNPLIDFDKIVLIDNPYPKGVPGDATDEWGHEARHRNGFMAVDGGRLMIVGLTPGSEAVNVLKDCPGSFWRPDVSYDGKKLLFSFQPEGDRSFHLYECDADGSGVKQLTRGDYDDLDPVYLPDGKITFCTSRQHSYVRCMPMTHSFAVARCDGDGRNIYILSANGEPEYLPSVLNDGRVIFTRWEYTDKALWRVQSLWTCDPDGCNVQTLWGSQSVWPDVLTEARAIPGSSKIMFTGLGHHAWFNGTIGMIDPAAGLNYPDGLYRLTRDVAWPEVGNGPKDPPPHVDYHASGKFFAYKTPYPLSEEYFLCSAREGNHLYSGAHNDWFFRLYLMDVYGNKELIYRGRFNAYHAMPFKPRPAPPAMSDKVKWPKIGSGETPANAVFYSNDVFENAPPVLREKGKFLRVIQMDPKTYTTWHKTVQHDGPAVSVFQADGVKRILGTVPIEEDGSVNFEIPPGQSIFFQMLDAEGRAIHVMRSFANGMPGEHRGCFGCHETSMKNRGIQASASYRRRGTALTRAPLKLQEPPWGAKESVGYARFVQPVLDRHCGACHQKPGTPAYEKLNMVYRPSSHGWWNWVFDRPGDISPFAEPYYTLVDGNCRWGGDKPKDERGVPKNLAGLFIVEGYNTTDPKNLETLPPYSAYSPVSTLIRNATSGDHHGVKVTGADRERLIAWVDCNGPFLGDEEIRAMYDPWSKTIETIPPIRPRIGTAPRIERFNLRQDGDTMALCGPLRLQPDRPDGYNPNALVSKLRQEEMLRQVTRENLKIVLVGANYGNSDEKTRVSVIDKLRPLFTGTRYIPMENYNSIFGDPTPNIVKTLRVAYTINNGPVKHAQFSENENILLPL